MKNARVAMPSSLVDLRLDLRPLGRVLAALAIVAFALVAAAPSAHAAFGTCDTASAVEVEASAGTVGPTGYASLTTAFLAINAGTHQGAITIDVCGNTAEPGGATLNGNGIGSASYTSIAISPAGGLGRTVSGAAGGGTALIELLGADNVTIDGLNTGGDSLTFDNTSTGSSATTIRFGLDASNNTVRKCTIKGAGTSNLLGTITFASGTTTGNFNDLIDGNTITSSGANLPVNAIYSASGGTINTASITNNNIQDYFSATLASNGILLASNSNGWTITGNKFFQTATRTATTGNTHRAINITTASFGGYTISNNVIGFATSAGTGSTVYAGAVANRFVAIELTAANAPASSIQGNTINGFTLSTTSAAASAPGIFDGISVLAGAVNIGTTSANTIGATSGSGTINVTSTTTGGFIGGITVASTGVNSIQNNNVGSVNTGGTAAIGYVFNGIQSSGAVGGFTISGNTIGSTTTANSIAIGLSGTTTAATSFVGVNNSATGTISITGNTIQNCSAFGSGSGNFFGISNTGSTGTLTITTNSIISGTYAGVSGGGGSCLGISNTAGAATANINTNVIRNFTITSTTAAVTGIVSSGAVTTALNVNGNQLGNASGGWINFTGAASGTLFGISTGGTTTAALSISNNDIRGITYAVASFENNTLINWSNSSSNAANINNNTFTNLNLNTSGNVTFLARAGSMTSTGSESCSNNSIVTAFNKAAGGTLTFFSANASSVSGSTMTQTGNNFSNITLSGAGAGITGWSNTEGATSANGPTKTITGNTFSSINAGSGTVNILTSDFGNNNTTVSSNTISNVTSTGAIVAIAIGTSNGGTTQSCNSNTISNLTSTGTGGQVLGISGGSSAITTTNFNNNPISGLSTTQTGSVLIGIAIGNGVTVNANGNTISSLSDSGSGANTVAGIRAGATTALTFSGNSITTLSSAGSSPTVSGILQLSGTTITASGNTIGGLSTTATTSPVINGISIATGTSVTISKNKIYDLSHSGAISTTSPAINGLLLTSSSAATTTVSNNILGDFRTPAASLTEAIRGISIPTTSTTATYNVYYNTVYISATSSGANFGTTGLFAVGNATATTSTLNLRNNIIDNRSTPNGTGQTVVYRRSTGIASTLANYASTSNNNDFFLGTAGANKFIYADGTSTASTIAAYKAGVFTAGTIAPRDSASFSDPTYVSTTGTDGTFLHIDPVTPTQTESGAVNIAGITDDFDGNTRQGNAGYSGSGTAPDVGADEFSGTALDLSPPIISYTALGRDGVAATRGFTAVTVTDGTGVNTTAGTRPRVYYKKSSDAANTFNGNTSATAGWKFVEASGAGGSPFSFTIDYSLLSGGAGVSVGDVIQYFVVAQDTATTPNVGINSGTFTATPASVALTAAAFPIGGTINTYTIVATLSGTKTVCTSGCDYSSLTNAGGVFADVNAKVLGGNLTLQITSNLTGETGGNALAPPVESPAGPWTITILPTGSARSVTGTGSGSTLIPILGADRVVIDGSIGGGGSDRSLTLSQPNATTGTGTVFIGSLGTGAGSTDITIKNCIIKAGNIGSTTNFTFGVFVGDASGASAGADNDNFTFQNNQVLQARTGLQMVGTAGGVDDNALITGNLIGDNTLANSIGRVGITFSVANNATLSNNTIKNIFLTADTSSATGMSLASLTSSSITGNSVTNVSNTGSSLTPVGLILSSSSGTTVGQNAISTIAASGSSGVPFGMFLTSSTGMTISANTVDAVTNSNSGDPAGIVLSTGFVSSTVTRNTISNVTYTGTGGYGGRGFEINTGSATSALTISNNAIYNIKGDGWSAFSSDSIAGIRITGTTGGLNFYFNSVNLGSGSFAGNSSGTLSAAMYIVSTATALDIRDNIFATNLVNSNAALAKTYAIYSDAAAGAFTNINNNDYFGGGAQGVLGNIGAADKTTIAAWRTATGQDVSSIASDPLFGSSTNLVPNVGSPVLGAGQTIAGITVDITGATRGSPPSIGAYESASDTTGPAISYTALANTTSTSNRSLSATVTDATGVPTSGTGLPVLYFKKNAGSYFASQGSFAGGSSYTFTFNYALVGGVTAGDTVSYYIAAQDTVGTPNVSVSPSSGASGFSANPPAVSTPPTSPSSYLISASISGIKTVCASGCDYTSLTLAAPGGAFADINGKVSTGNIEIQIAGDLSGETGANALNPLAEEPTGSNFTVKVYPTGASAVESVRTVTGSSASSLITLNAADRVTIDGSNGGAGTSRLMTITNTNTGTSSAVIWLQSNGVDGATSNTIKNLNIVGSNTFAASANGTLIGVGSGSSTISITSTGTGNNNNTYQNNSISKSQYGIYSGGASAASKNTGTAITQNAINTASPNGVTTGGILVNFDNGVQVTRNDVGNILKHDGTTGTTGTAFAIALGVVPNNSVTTFTGSDVTGAVVTQNRIDTVVQLNSTGYSAFGIVVNSVTSGTTLLANNMVSGVRSAATASDFTGGIILGGGTGSTTQAYYNSVNMTGARGAASYPSYALAINSGDPTVDLRDNILVNTQTSSSTGKSYAIASGGTTFANLTSNNNDLFVSGAAGVVGQTGGLGTAGTDSATLTAWQTATGKDGASISADPGFVSAGDLHISRCVTSAVNNAGVAIGAVTTDYDGETRSGSTPDIGADESSPAIPCNDGNDCTSDTCNPTTGCVFTNVPSGTACGSSADTACDNPDTCNGSGACQANNEVNGTACGDAGTSCTNQDTCFGGSCQDNGFQPSGTACGSASDTACDNPDTCNGSGACQANNEVNGTFCGDAGTSCTNQDTCFGGACQDNGFQPSGTACGSSSDTDCDNPDTCNGSGTCQTNNETDGISCGTPGTCENQDTCQSGLCHDNGFSPSGTACGSSSDTECDNPDTCNGSGSCQANNESNGTFCGDSATSCTNQDTCFGGACQDAGYQPSGTACGSNVDTECDNPDTCNGLGACQTNNEADGHFCGDAGSSCTNQDTCLSGACHDNGFQPSGTSCGSNADTECDNPDTCNGSGSCQANNETNGTFCGDAGTSCTNQDTCFGGACQDAGYQPSGTACGSGVDTECDNPDTCNGSGACQTNNEADGHFCGDAGSSCTNQDTCLSGACHDNGFQPSGTSCGSNADTECDNPDTCNGSGACQANNESNGTFCGDAGTSCTNQDTCFGGACQDAGYQPSGTACGSNTDTECDNPDTCNGLGACQTNNEADGHLCGDAGTSCTNQDTCQSGLCHDNGFQPSGTACGSNADTECDNPDTCDGSGACQLNNEADGHLCGDAGTSCTNQDTCQSGACHDNGFQPSGTACGSNTDTECDNPDTCNGSGSCQSNNEANGHFCGDAGTSCTNQDTCFGGLCQDNGFQPSGTACGSNADTDCDNPDACNGSGVCQSNNEADGHLCGDAGTSCTNQDTCSGGLCQDNGFQPSGTACGSNADTDCDNPDTCNGSGTCQLNNEANGHLCGDAGTSCTNQDTCLSGLCHDNGFQPSGTACGSPTDTDCDNPDTCDGSGACQLNYEASGHACSDGLGCTTGDNCNGSGVCASTGTVVCDDHSSCTNESCVEPSGACSYVSTGTCDINGTVRYYRDSIGPVEPSTKGISGESVSRTSSLEATSSATTSSSGAYGFTNEGGNVTLTPAQVRVMVDEDECHNSITAADATMISRGSVGLVTLTTNQRIAADVSNNGQISAFDAALTAQKAVAMPCLAYQFPVRAASGSDWAFRPVSRSYTPLTGIGEDYSFLGVVYGDVTGNWTAPVLFGQSIDDAPPAPGLDTDAVNAADQVDAVDAETTLADASIRVPASVFEASVGNTAFAQASGGAVIYLASAPVKNADGTWSIVFGLQRADGILGLDMGLKYDPSVIQVRAVTATGIGAAYAVAGRDSDKGYAISMFGVEALRGSGWFLTVTYTATGSATGMPFSVDAQANEGQIPISWVGVPRATSDPVIRLVE